MIDAFYLPEFWSEGVELLTAAGRGAGGEASFHRVKKQYIVLLTTVLSSQR